MAFGVDRPSRIPSDFPGVIVGIGDIAPIAAMRRCIAWPEHPPACSLQCRDHCIDLFRRPDIMGEREGPRASERGPRHVLGELCLKPCAEDQTVHLIEGDFLVREHRRPAEAFAIEAAGPDEIRDPERHDCNLLLHASVSDIGSLTTAREPALFPRSRSPYESPKPDISSRRTMDHEPPCWKVEYRTEIRVNLIEINIILHVIRNNSS